MSVKTKMTAYCDEANCQVNQTFVITGIEMKTTIDKRGVPRPVLDVLKEMGWRVLVGTPIAGQVESGRRVLTLCPAHADPETDPDEPVRFLVVT